ncbi:uncharacterized protein LODBEIA_P45600 [Lodderomyces beijingensis]|uniref:DUF7702 domain-containing protein n=1 Tax=Lodderomyces beijingensis TaxID=1775926 RepID=A0ABP0ZTN8_9ASCO
MQVSFQSQWMVTSGFQLGIFIISALVFAAITTWQLKKGIQLKSITGFFVFMAVFHVFKIAGGVTGLVFLKSDKFNKGVFIATYIFDSISVGFLLRGVSSLVQHMLSQKLRANIMGKLAQPTYLGTRNDEFELLGDETSVKKEISDAESTLEAQKKKDPLKNTPFRVVTIVLLAAVITSVVGTSSLTEGDTSSTAETLLRVSSVLFVVGDVLLVASLLYLWAQGEEYVRVAPLLILALLILLVRCAYSIVSAFHGVSFDQPSRYMLMFGDYKYYAFMGLLVEAIADIFLLLAYSRW